MNEKRARITDRDLCMECGACANNCEFEAISVESGVGCAAAIIFSAFKGLDEPCCGPVDDDTGSSGCC